MTLVAALTLTPGEQHGHHGCKVAELRIAHSDRKPRLCLPKLQVYQMATVWIIKVGTSGSGGQQQELLLDIDYV